MSTHHPDYSVRLQHPEQSVTPGMGSLYAAHCDGPRTSQPFHLPMKMNPSHTPSPFHKMATQNAAAWDKEKRQSQVSPSAGEERPSDNTRRIHDQGKRQSGLVGLAVRVDLAGNMGDSSAIGLTGGCSRDGLPRLWRSSRWNFTSPPQTTSVSFSSLPSSSTELLHSPPFTIPWKLHRLAQGVSSHRPA